jgi:hypothetical protein
MARGDAAVREEMHAAISLRAGFEGIEQTKRTKHERGEQHNMHYRIRVANGGRFGAEARAAARIRRQANARRYESQLAAIRNLMRRAVVRGAWLTLSEIAKATEFGEASISAQLRHLRKSEHGGYRVEKRRRRQLPSREETTRRQSRKGERAAIVWEYRVLPPR